MSIERIEIVEGDITRLAVDAIVNAANSSLLGLTRGYGLPAPHVIHTVGPVWRGGGANEEALLASCYRRSLELAAQHRLSSIAFPAISTGIYGFPADRAAEIAVDTIARTLAGRDLPERVILCCFGEASAAAHRAALAWGAGS
ncbi:MAG: macro domain-containing protein [Rhodospirillales bacterium]|nr:macro domain-containing protein [Rhodospirillales bacterium]